MSRDIGRQPARFLVNATKSRNACNDFTYVLELRVLAQTFVVTIAQANILCVGPAFVHASYRGVLAMSLKDATR